MDDLSKLEDKVDKLILLINELKQKVEDWKEQNTKFKIRDKEIKEKLENLIERIDKLVF